MCNEQEYHLSGATPCNQPCRINRFDIRVVNRIAFQRRGNKQQSIDLPNPSGTHAKTVVHRVSATSVQGVVCSGRVFCFKRYRLLPGEPSVPMSLKHSPSSQTSRIVEPALASGSETLI